jgi:hypothetical protein
MLAVLFTAEVLVMLDGIVVSVALPEIGTTLACGARSCNG